MEPATHRLTMDSGLISFVMGAPREYRYANASNRLKCADSFVNA